MKSGKRPKAPVATPGDVFAYRLASGRYGALQVFASSSKNCVELVALEGEWPKVPTQADAKKAKVHMRTFDGIWIEGRGFQEKHVGVDHIYADAEVPWWATHVGHLPLKSVTIDTVVVGDWYGMTRRGREVAPRKGHERFPFELKLNVGDVAQYARKHPTLELLTVQGPGVVDVDALLGFPSLKQLCLRLDGGGIDRCSGLSGLRDLRELELDGVFSLDVDELPDAWPSLQRVTIRGGRKKWSATLARKLAGVASVTIRGLKDEVWIAENLGCPFSTWVDVSPALSRGAVKAWKQARRELAGLGPSAGARAEPSLRKLVEALNRLHARHDIESAERDHAATVFFAMAADHGVSRAVAETWFDAWRQF